MQSFYGGPAGQSFEIKQVFSSFYGPNGAQADLVKGWASPISVGEFVMISYGKPTDPEYLENQKQDLEKGEKKNLNSTLWQKVYNESVGEGSGLSYKFITSCAGNTPKISITTPATVLNANQQPQVNTDLSNPDLPVISFALPQSQVLSIPNEVTVLDANQNPSVEYNDDNINRPTLHFNLPQSQVIEQAEVIPIAVGETPKVELDTTNVNRPVLKFQLPVVQEFLNSNVLHEILDADKEPTVSFAYAPEDTNHEHPILTFSLPRSQVMAAPERVVQDPAVEPSVEDVGTVNAPKLRFKLPRAVAFYYGTFLGERSSGTYTLSNSLFSSYGVGDYYVNAPTGFIYKVTSKTDDTTCVFEYQACIQSPLPSVESSSIAPYVQDETGYVPAGPQVNRYLTNNEGTEWKLEFELPEAPKPAVSSSFIGSTEQGSVTSSITSEDTITFTFKIPTGSKLFTGLEIIADGATTTVDGARLGDVYLNSETGVLYTLTSAGWKASEKSIKGPVGDALNIEAEYQLTETTSYAASLENGSAYIEGHYTGTIDSYKIFAITWTLLNNGGNVSYWYFKTNAGEWARTQLTGGISNLIENAYKTNIDNKAYSVNYLNSLIEGKDGETGKLTTYSKAKIDELLAALDGTLNTWGSFADLPQ